MRNFYDEITSNLAVTFFVFLNQYVLLKGSFSHIHLTRSRENILILIRTLIKIFLGATAKTLGKGRRNPFVKTFWVKEFTGKGPHKFKIYEEN